MTASAHRRFRMGGRKVRRALVAAAMVAGLVNLSSGTSYAVHFCNTNPIAGTNNSGPLGLYPSPIVVSGLTGTITDVNIILLGLTTSADLNGYYWVEDLDVMVSGPTGASAVIMSDAGGNNDDVQPALSGVTLILDDQAANQLPADTALSSGRFRPVDDDTEHISEAQPVDAWAPPAPAPGGSALTVFNGTNPNGTWNLWAMDDTMLAINDFTGGWCIEILTTGTSSSSSSSSSSTSSTVPATTTCNAPPPATITAQPGVFTFGTPGNDVIYGTAGHDRISGGGGDDIIVGMGGDDQLSGGEGNDVVCGGAGNDQIAGDGGNDSLVGDDGDDALSGGGGDDRLIGGLGLDRLSGGPGVDQCNAGGQPGDFSNPAPDCDTVT